jgi:hypothetical protein
MAYHFDVHASVSGVGGLEVLGAGQLVVVVAGELHDLCGVSGRELERS